MSDRAPAGVPSVGDEIAAFQDAYQAAFNRSISRSGALAWIGRGIPMSLLPSTADLTAAATARWSNTVRSSDPADRVSRLLLTAVSNWTGRLPRDQVPPWLGVVAAAVDFQAGWATYTEATAALGVRDPSTGRSVWAGLPGGVGALAWAAGLGAHEAETVPVAEQHVLAALRGWTLPPVGVR